MNATSPRNCRGSSDGYERGSAAAAAGLRPLSWYRRCLCPRAGSLRRRPHWPRRLGLHWHRLRPRCQMMTDPPRT